jgi:TolB-like protein
MVLAFDGFRLDIDRRELRHHGQIVGLEPQAFDLLAFLVLHRDRVVSKDDLLEGVWGGRIVSETALTTRINTVRRALGDNGTAQKLIRTFTRKGVRFVGEVTELPGRDQIVSSHAAGSARETGDRPSIAVLPFRNLTGDPEQQYFVDGMVEEITIALARFPWLGVMACDPGLTSSRTAADVKQVARELGVRYVLEGSVRKAGTRVRIAGQLIDAATGAHLWAERFDGALDDVFDLKDVVASRVAGAVEPQLRFAEIARTRRKPTESLDAYDCYLRGLAGCHDRTREGTVEAVRQLRRALEIDPGYAAAMALISGLRCMQRNRHWIPNDGSEIEEAIGLARKAIVSGGDEPEGLAIAGLSLAFLAGDNKAALSAIDRAIALNPNLALAWGRRALVLIFLNRPDEAIASAQRAIRLSPREPRMFLFVQAMAFAHLAAGRYEEGLPWAEEAIRENGGLVALRFKLSLCGHLGRLEEAGACLRRIRETIPEPTVASVMQGHGKGIASEVVARLADGLRKAGLPDE